MKTKGEIQIIFYPNLKQNKIYFNLLNEKLEIQTLKKYYLQNGFLFLFVHICSGNSSSFFLLRNRTVGWRGFFFFFNFYFQTQIIYKL